MGEPAELLDIGSITIFVNIPDECHDNLTKKEILAIEEEVVNQYWELAKVYDIDKDLISIRYVETEQGCVLCTIGFCAITSTGILEAAGGISAFIIAYPKICDGLKRMAEHSQWVYCKFKNSKEKRKQRKALYKNNLKTQEEIEKALEDLQKRKGS